jgi:hypothetical protein
MHLLYVDIVWEVIASILIMLLMLLMRVPLADAFTIACMLNKYIAFVP